MRKLILTAIFGFLALVPAARAQETGHAPTVAQCRADAAVWLLEPKSIVPPTQVPDHSTPGRAYLSTFSFNTLGARSHELEMCSMAVDPPVTSGSKYEVEESWVRAFQYASLNSIYEAEMTRRLFVFVKAHGLMNQFTEETESKK